MAKTLIWSPKSIADLDSIGEYISKDSPKYAHITVQKIFGIVQTIPEFPLLGRQLPERTHPNLRERITGNFRIVYRITESTIEVVTIHHSAMPLLHTD